MGSHGMRTHLASLTIPLNLVETIVGNPRLEDARICNLVSCGCWYIIFLDLYSPARDYGSVRGVTRCSAEVRSAPGRALLKHWEKLVIQ